MKRIVVVLLCIAFGQYLFSQEDKNTSVEKSLFGVQTGLLGFWAHNEYRLTNSISLRSEVGLDIGVLINGDSDDTFVLIPVIRLEPRWYYNLKKRNIKKKNTSKNSGNFFTLSTTYNPDWFSVSNSENITIANTIAFVPKWGIKRTYKESFTFETGIGIGYIATLDSDTNLSEDVAVDLHVRIGYTF
jgi:hypothetical protein